MTFSYWLLGILITVGVTVLLTLLTVAFKYGNWKGAVDTDRSNFNAFMNEIREDIKQILQRLPSPVPTQSTSPLELTEYGQKLFDSLGAKEWAKRIADDLIDQVRDKEAYEINEFGLNYVNNEFKPDEEQDANIRKCAYEHGAPRNHINEVLALELRDELLTRTGLMDQVPKSM